MAESRKRVPERERVPWYLPRDRRWRRRLKFTREGKLFVFVTLGLGFGAVNTGTNMMYLVFGFMLSLIILSGILSEHVLRKLHVTRRLPGRAFAGEPALIEIVVRNEKQRLVSYSLEIEDLARDLPNDRRCYFLKVAPGTEQVASYRRVPSQRGRVVFSGFRVATRFPFALFEKSRELEIEDELLVYPRRLPAALPDGLQYDEGDQAGTSKGRGVETRELREYRAHDELRAVHWGRTAALGKHVVREFEREAGNLISIRLDNYCPEAGDVAWERRFEQDVSRAAHLVERALSQGHGVEVCARGDRSQLLKAQAAPDAIFRFLALIAARAEPLDFAVPQAGARVVDLRSLGSEESERAA